MVDWLRGAEMGRILHTTSQFSRQFFRQLGESRFYPTKITWWHSMGSTWGIPSTLACGIWPIERSWDLDSSRAVADRYKRTKSSPAPFFLRLPTVIAGAKRFFYCGFLWYFLMVSRTPQTPKCCQFALRVSKQLTTIVILCLQFLRADQDAAISLRFSSPHLRHALPTVMASKS